ncbi:MAG: DUF1232 domain-containing protein [bacterium]|nr:DUF1232 domain-containing protein [bacterium]
MSVLIKLQEAAGRIRHDAMTVYFAARDPRTPFFVRLLALAIAAYALSPIDLIPDFIPVLGYLDDVILLPLGIILVIRLTPAEVIEASRARASEAAAQPVSKVAAAVIVVIWAVSVAGSACWLFRASGP